ncbi:MAG: TonB-dependent receptor, partial [Sphingomonadaceae bacterium]|nr:TonB-dependent receptor [Sphingomonadaceae bacterium]
MARRKAARQQAVCAAMLAVAATAPVAAQEAPEEPDIVVTGRAPAQPGAVVGDIKPEIQLSPADIRSYGVSSVADLLNELAPQTRSDRGTGGAPLVLLNGHRISGFSEIRDLPTEAILRVDILPEEVALKYGAPADQRVVNFVLRPRFRATTAEATGGTATEGGAANVAGSADYLRIKKDGRLNLDLKATHVDALTEADRGIVADTPAVAGDAPDVTRFRTLTRDADTEQLNAIYNRLLPGDLSATVNFRAEFDQSEGENGLGLVSLSVPGTSPFGPPAGPATVARYATGLGPLLADTNTSSLHLGTTLNHDGKDWRWSLVTNFDRTDTRTKTDSGADASVFQALVIAGGDPLAPFGTAVVPRAPDTSRSLAQSGSIDGLVSGSPLTLPAGDVDVSAKLLGSFSGFDGESLRRGVAQTTHFTRNLVSGQLNLDVPLTSRKAGFGGAIGDLSANGNFAAQYLSDFGTLTTFGYGLHWTPRKPLSLVASHTDDHAAPSVQQLQGPVVTTPNAAIFDPQTGTTVFATLVSGGNPALQASARHVTKVEANWKPLAKPDLTVTANYVETHVTNAIAAFPATSAAIEAAFADRFVRDAAGDFVSVDTRPVNFAREDSATLRYGFNLAIPLKSTQVNPFAGLRRPEGAPG